MDGGQQPTPLTWSPITTSLAPTLGVTQKLGVFFLQSSAPHGLNVTIPWNVRSTMAAITDGTSSTLMLSENTLAGVSNTPSAFSANMPETNWSSPIPQLTMFIGSSAICSSASYNCTGGILAPASASSTGSTASGDADGIGWAFANKVGTYENINYGTTGGLSIKGSFPFSNSGHPGGCNMMFSDGAVRFVTNTIDGTVYSKLITPAGARLPVYARQMPLSQDAFASQ